MARGNINYKYLRRRQSWFKRNWKFLLIVMILLIAIGLLGTVILYYYF